MKCTKKTNDLKKLRGLIRLTRTFVSDEMRKAEWVFPSLRLYAVGNEMTNVTIKDRTNIPLVKKI